MALASLTVADTAPPVIDARLPTRVSSSFPAFADAANPMDPINVAITSRTRIAAQHSARPVTRQPRRAAAVTAVAKLGVGGRGRRSRVEAGVVLFLFGGASNGRRIVCNESP